MEPGSMIGGRYQLVDVVAEGGLSTVWQGVARSSEVFARPVAIKVMKRAFSTVGGPYLSMFLEEARIGARLQHANVIQVLDFIVEATPAGPTYCLVMEWVDGIDLRSMLRVENAMGRKLSWALVATVGLRVLRGLAAAHERRLPDTTVSPAIPPWATRRRPLQASRRWRDVWGRRPPASGCFARSPTSTSSR